MMENLLGMSNVNDKDFVSGKEPFFAQTETDKAFAALIAPMLRMKLWQSGKGSVVTFFANDKVSEYIKDAESFAKLGALFASAPLFVAKKETAEEQYSLLEKELEAYQNENGNAPSIIAIEALGVFAHGASKKACDAAKSLFLKGVLVLCGAEKELLEKAAANYAEIVKTEEAKACGRMSERIMVVTGSAQGFGQGIAEEIIKEGANVIIADLNEALAIENAKKLSDSVGAEKAVPVKVDVSDEASVENMYIETVLEFGGVDALVNNAGIVRAGNLEEMTVPMLDLVTKVNYTAYFLCTKYAVKYMKIQNRFCPEYFMDIIQINSKSGLAGSNKNFAYAGSKFGGIGLTQSFALELTPFNIKVNSICPGNFLDGPLWMDPEKGLFVQYLKAGKVPGAKTVDDVRRAYESKVPMNRGCRVMDVVRAIYYCVEQEYETGQAIPVTGGQEMLK